MADIDMIEQRVSGKSRGRARRSCNLSTKLTADEAKAVQEAAARAGKTPSEWARDRLLSSVVVGGHTQMEMHIFTTRSPRNSSPSSFAKSRQPRPQRRRNSSPSAARARRNSHAPVQQWARRELNIWPPTIILAPSPCSGDRSAPLTRAVARHRGRAS